MTKWDIARICEFGHSMMTYGYSGYLSGYETSINERVISDLRSGGLVLDHTKTEYEQRSLETIHGPMLGVELDREGTDRCPMPSSMLLAGLSGSYQMLAVKRAVDENFNGLDQVGIGIYLRRWEAIGGELHVLRDKLVKVTVDDIYEELPQLHHNECHWWGKVSIWQFGNRYEVRWGGNGFDVDITAHDNFEEARNFAAKKSWDTYNSGDPEWRARYNGEDVPKLVYEGR